MSHEQASKRSRAKARKQEQFLAEQKKKLRVIEPKQSIEPKRIST